MSLMAMQQLLYYGRVINRCQAPSSETHRSWLVVSKAVKTRIAGHDVKNCQREMESMLHDSLLQQRTLDAKKIFLVCIASLPQYVGQPNLVDKMDRVLVNFDMRWPLAADIKEHLSNLVVQVWSCFEEADPRPPAPDLAPYIEPPFLDALNHVAWLAKTLNAISNRRLLRVLNYDHLSMLNAVKSFLVALGSFDTDVSVRQQYRMVAPYIETTQAVLRNASQQSSPVDAHMLTTCCQMIASSRDPDAFKSRKKIVQAALDSLPDFHRRADLVTSLKMQLRTFKLCTDWSHARKFEHLAKIVLTIWHRHSFYGPHLDVPDLSAFVDHEMEPVGRNPRVFEMSHVPRARAWPYKPAVWRHTL
ncbi:hypothetical protein OIV83_006148 [Microbotryomycetes sp. JL201]|nr:hypothetical protein OIV83_006148 [Microbotryomycetes sp. JL201]